MPLFDGFLTKAKVGQAEAQFQKTRSQKVLLESALSVQIDHLHTTLTELRERVEDSSGGHQRGPGKDTTCRRWICGRDYGI